MKKNLDISVVIPVFNEEESLVELNNQILNSINENNTYELIYVNDGSTDQSKNIITTLASKNSNIKLINFYKNKGKADALNAGFYFSSGKIVITLDSDLQDDPNEFQKLIKEIDNGSDMVSGWKRNRKDPISKTFPSKIFNFVLRLLTGIRIHDFNCGLKAYNQKVVKSLNIYGGLHRFIPVLVKNSGFNISEVEINHRKRKYGVSKYGTSRMFHGLFDLITILFLKKYFNRPLHFFGKFGILFSLLGFFINIYLSYKWIIFNYFNIGIKYSINRPLLFLGILLLLVGIQFISIGLIGELIVYLNKERNFNLDEAEYINFN